MLLLYDANTSTAVGDFSTILRTTNGGENWITQNISNSGETWNPQTSRITNYLNDVSFVDADNSIIVSDDSLI